MKKLVVVLFILCLGTVSAVAQIPADLASKYYDQEQRERVAKINANWLANRVNLSDEQTQKVYDLYMKKLVAEASAETREERFQINKEYNESVQEILTPKQKKQDRNFYKHLGRVMGSYDEIINLTPEELQRRVKSTTGNIAEQLDLSQEQKQKFFDLEMERLTKIKSSTGAFDNNNRRYYAEYMAGLEKILTPEQWARIEKPATPAQKTPEEIAKEKKKTEKNIERTRKDLQKKLDKAAKQQQKAG